MKGGLECRSLRANIFREISLSRQRGCDEGTDCGYMERFPPWVKNMKRDYRELLLIVNVRGHMTGKTRDTFVTLKEFDQRTLSKIK